MSQSVSAFVSAPRFRVRRGQALVFLIAVLGFMGLVFLRNLDNLTALELSGLITMGVVGIWRWAWFGLHVARWLIYEKVVFPRWRRQANAIPVEALYQLEMSVSII
jgi:mannuronan synthase